MSVNPLSFKCDGFHPIQQINHDVTPDSVLLLHAARTVVEEEEFDNTLQSVRDRVDEIESLHRTRELTVSPMIRYQVELSLMF